MDELEIIALSFFDSSDSVVDVLEDLKSVSTFEANLMITSEMSNGTEFAKKTTPSQMVASNPDILSMIFGHITNLKQRANIELCCKQFYEVCNQKSPHRSFFMSEDRNDISELCRIHGDGNIRIDISNHEMQINIPQSFSFDEENLLVFEKFFKKYLPKMKCLYIQNMQPQHVDFFKELECFETIEELKMEFMTLIKSGNLILSQCKTLNPEEVNILDEYKICSEDIELPSHEKSYLKRKIKDIDFILGGKYLDWFLGEINILKVGCFENLKLKEPISTTFQNEQHAKSFLELIIYFKNISFIYDGFDGAKINKSFYRTLLENNINSNILIFFSKRDFYINCMFGNAESKLSNVSSLRKILNQRENRLLAQPGIYLSTKKLKILDFLNARVTCSFFDFEVERLIEDISRMKYLSLFEIYFNLFENEGNFMQLCAVLNRIKTIRIHRCGSMQFHCLEKLSECAENLENMSLVQIGSESITIARILSKFKKLNSLEVVYDSSYNVTFILEDLIKIDNTTGRVTFKWPNNLGYLNIICSCLSGKQLDLIEKVERETPRKCGQLLMRNILFEGSPRYQILVRLSKASCNKFHNPLYNNEFKLKHL